MGTKDWTVEKVIKTFGLNSDGSDLSALQEELRTRIIGLHPDKQGGQFASETQADDFTQATDALQFLRNSVQHQYALVPLNEIAPLIKSLTEALAINDARKLNESTTNFITGLRGHIRLHYLGPKITSGLCATVLGGISGFAGKLQNHPLFGPLASSRLFMRGALILAIFSACLFVFTWIKEQSHASAAEYLTSNDGTLSSFADFCSSGSFYQLEKDEHSQTFQFTRRSYVRFLANGDPKFMRLFIWWGKYKRRPRLPWEFRLDGISAERLAEIHLERLQKKSIIMPIQKVDVDDWYSIQAQFVAKFQQIQYE